MVTEEQVRWIGLFFLFSFMDEKTALLATHRTVAHLKATVAADREAEEGKTVITRDVLIKTLRKMFDQHRRLLPRNRPTTQPESVWRLPDHFDIAAWSKFQKDSSDGEVVAVVLSRVLRFTDDEIAEGMNLSLGTVRYRLGKAIRQLGAAAITMGAKARA